MEAVTLAVVGVLISAGFGLLGLMFNKLSNELAEIRSELRGLVIAVHDLDKRLSLIERGQ
jgi:hypothetical protein